MSSWHSFWLAFWHRLWQYSPVWRIAARRSAINRLRRMADVQGLRYQVNRRLTGGVIHYGRIWLTDAQTNTVVSEFTPGVGEGTILDQVEAWLTGNR